MSTKVSHDPSVRLIHMVMKVHHDPIVRLIHMAMKVSHGPKSCSTHMVIEVCLLGGVSIAGIEGCRMSDSTHVAHYKIECDVHTSTTTQSDSCNTKWDVIHVHICFHYCVFLQNQLDVLHN